MTRRDASTYTLWWDHSPTVLHPPFRLGMPGPLIQQLLSHDLALAVDRWATLCDQTWRFSSDSPPGSLARLANAVVEREGLAVAERIAAELGSEFRLEYRRRLLRSSLPATNLVLADAACEQRRAAARAAERMEGRRRLQVGAGVRGWWAPAGRAPGIRNADALRRALADRKAWLEDS